MPKVKRRKWYVYDGELVPLSDEEWTKYGHQIRKKYSTFTEETTEEDGYETAEYEVNSGMVLAPNEEDDVQIPLPQLAAAWQAAQGQSSTVNYTYDETGWSNYPEDRNDAHEREMRLLLVAMATPREVKGFDDVKEEVRHFGYI